MIKDILIDVKDNEIRLAVIEDGELSEILIEKTENKSLVGNIYRAKVERVLSGMQSAFVDIGFEKNAYLYVKDVIPPDYKEDGETVSNSDFPDISNLLNQGNEISVQVIKDAVGEKGPRVTTHISLPGRYAVLMPGSNAGGISKKIEDSEERQRLMKITEENKPEGCGLILRTAALNVDEKLILEDINTLLTAWSDIKSSEIKGRVPRLLYSDSSILTQAVREHLSADINKFIVNDRESYEKIIALPELSSTDSKAKVELYSKGYDMFEYYNVQSAQKEALSRKVWLKSGAYLVFDYTEALTVIDVNSGKYIGKTDLEETALSINLEAAKKIAAQIRLRNLSGIIIIDFIDMKQNENKEQLIQAMRDFVKNDKIQTVVIGMTKLGLVEITRKKIRNSLSQLVGKSPLTFGE